MKRPFLAIAAFVLLLLSGARGLSDGGDAARFPFLTPWDDAAANFVDVGSLNDGPAGSHGFIAVRDGHFVEGDTGRRVRFLGTNIALDGLFPAHDDAEKLAAHLAKYGINAVRFHHQDATWDGPDFCLWDRAYRDHRHIDAAKLEKMDYLAAQLEKHGIYIDMCLHVSRKLSAADGFPPGVVRVPYPFDKRVDIFDPQMIAADREYFRDLLAHVNPYTSRSYAADPGVLMVEINNENSLLGLYGETPGADLMGLPEPYGRELSDLWNGWLARKYGATAALAAAWASPDRTTGPNLYPPVGDPAAWTLETQATTAALLAADDGGLRVDVSKVDATAWHVQLYRKGLGLLRNGAAYTLTLEMRADRERTQRVQANLDHPDYPGLGLEETVRLTPHWETYSFHFTARNAEEGHNRMPALILGAEAGSTWLRNVTLRAGDGPYALPASQSLEARTVWVEPSGRRVPRADWLSFLVDTEAAYVASMRSYLRDDLGVKTLVFCSQTAFGGLWGNYRELAGDANDHHGYWDYHDTVAEPIGDQPMVRSLGDGDVLSSLAQERTAGQPAVVTEYNICFPNEFRAEMVPGYASFAAFQDWDAIFLFTHGGYGARGARLRQNDRIDVPLEASVDPAVWGFLPSAAMIFRGGLIPAAPSVRTLALPASFPADRVAAGFSVARAWQDAALPALAPFQSRLQLGLGLPGALPASDAPAGVLRVQADDPDTARYVADAPAAKVVFGFVGGQTVSFSGATVAFGPLTARFGALTLAALDGRPLEQSSRVLLTLVTHTQNTGQTWNAAHTLLTRLGQGPPQVDRAAATVSLKTDGPRVVTALDGSGEKQEAIPATYRDGQTSFSITPAQQSIWYAITSP